MNTQHLQKKDTSAPGKDQPVVTVYVDAIQSKEYFIQRKKITKA